MIPTGLVYSIHDPTEVAIQKMIDVSERMLKVNSQGELGGMSSPLKRHLEIEIKALENAPRDADTIGAALADKTKTKGRSHRDRRRSKVGYRDGNAKGCIVFGKQRRRSREREEERKRRLACYYCCCSKYFHN